VLTALREGDATVSLLSARFRGVSRHELLTRLNHLCRSGQAVAVGNHRLHLTDRRFRATEPSHRPRGRTYCHKFQLAVWRRLRAQPQTMRDLRRATGITHAAVRRALLALEREGAARRSLPAPARRTWVRGDGQPSCATTRAALGTRDSLLAFLSEHPGVVASSLTRRWSRGTIDGAIRAGVVRGSPVGVNQALWLAADAPATDRAARIVRLLAGIGAATVSTVGLITNPEDSDCLLLLTRNGWLEGDVARVSGYGLTDHRSGAVPALDALRSYVQHHGKQTVASLGAARPVLMRRLQHQNGIPAAVDAGLLARS
jgi:DNA-binding HxlR family transcriptional regulator